jgi:hypothetical protein
MAAAQQAVPGECSADCTENEMEKYGKKIIRVDGDVAYIPLTQGYEAVIDVADLPIIEGINFCAFVRPNTIYAVSKYGKGGMMHQMINRTPDGFVTDHIDGNGLNNRRSNLRTALQSENLQNKRKYKNNTSGFKGVSWHSSSKKWRAAICVNKTTTRLGSYETAEEAYKAYCEASKSLHPNFGRVM